MPVYKYKAIDASKKMRTGVVEAPNSKDARMQLLSGNLFLLELVATTGESAPREPASGFLGRKKADELALVTRQFATLVKAGVPIADALEILIEVIESRKLSIAFRDVKECVLQGMSLEDSLKRHPRFFSPFYVNMVKVGEASGNMDEVLTRLASFLHGQSRVLAKVRAALTYPVLMMIIGLAVVSFLVTFIVPTITEVLVESGKELPTPTVILMAVSDFLGRFWWLVIAALAGLFLLYKAVVATESGKMARDRLLIRLPVFGDLIKKNVIARFAMTFATLLRSGLPALESLKIVKETVRNKVLEETVGRVHDRIIEGGDISSILRNSEVFPPLVGYMITIGEESGRLEEMLGIISEYYDEEIEFATARFTSVLEPLLIIVLAALVGFVVLSVVLPILEMSDIV